MGLDAVFLDVRQWLEDEPLLRDSSNDNVGDKLAEEVKEYRDDPCLMEAADVFIAWAGSVSKCGMALEDIVLFAERKMRVNRNRVWERQPDGTIHHVEVVEGAH